MTYGYGYHQITVPRTVPQTAEELRSLVEQAANQVWPDRAAWRAEQHEWPDPPPPEGDLHPLDDPSFEIEQFLGELDLPDPDGECQEHGHWVAFELGRRRIGTVTIDPTLAPLCLGTIMPSPMVAWARCKACHWPVWALEYTNATGINGTTAAIPECAGMPTFHQACGWDPSMDSWRILTPARAIGLGIEWPVPWTFITPRCDTSAPW